MVVALHTRPTVEESASAVAETAGLRSTVCGHIDGGDYVEFASDSGLLMGEMAGGGDGVCGCGRCRGVLSAK